MVEQARITAAIWTWGTETREQMETAAREVSQIGYKSFESIKSAIHDFDMARFLAGCDAEEVYAQSANLVDPAIGEAGDVDTAVITLKMENGAIAVIDNCRKAVYGYDQRAEVFGSEGMAAISNDSQSTTVISNAQGVTGEKPMFFFLERYMDAYGKEITAFIDAIEKGKDTPLNVYDGLKPVLMGLAAKKSSQEHRPVKISEIMGE